jgi:hypothetical protein
MKILFLLSLLLALPMFGQTGVSVMVKQHENRPDFAERPYGKDDVSTGLFLDLFEGVGGWRFGASTSGDLSGIAGVDSVITPEITLLVVDRTWETGISVLMDYVDSGDGGEWGDVYFQTQFGINFPITSNVQLGAHMFYPLESIGDLVDIGFSDLDLAVQLRILF